MVAVLRFLALGREARASAVVVRERWPRRWPAASFMRVRWQQAGFQARFMACYPVVIDKWLLTRGWPSDAISVI